MTEDNLKRVSFTAIVDKDTYNKVIDNFDNFTCDVIIKENGKVFCTKEPVEDFSELWDSLFVKSASDFLVNNFKKFETSVYLELESSTYKNGLMQVTSSGANIEINSVYRRFFNLDYACICLKYRDGFTYFFKFFDSNEVRFMINVLADTQQRLASAKGKIIDMLNKLDELDKEEKNTEDKQMNNSGQKLTLDVIKKRISKNIEAEKEQIEQTILKNLENEFQYCTEAKSVTLYTKSINIFPNFRSFKRATELAKKELKKRGFKVKYRRTKYNFSLEIYGW